jgi:hypothetical protein
VSRTFLLAAMAGVLAGCSGPPPAAAPLVSASSNMVTADWAVASVDLDAVTFDCSRAMNPPAQLRATAGPTVTHAQVLTICLRRLQQSSADLRAYDLALVRAHDLPMANRDLLHGFTLDLIGLVDSAATAAGADDMPSLTALKAQIADVEARMLMVGA